MQDTQSTAIPFVYLQNQKFVVSQQAKKFLNEIKTPIAVLTIVGKYRTGKSLFLNRIMLGKSKAFKVSPTINSCTKGLWLWKDTLKFQNDQQQKQILIIDTEGFGATQQSDAYNNKILLFALLLSSYFVYNSVGSIDQNSLNNISVLANLANQIQSKNAKDQNIQQHFPSFMWLVRDFTLNLVDKNDIPIQAKQYLQQALQIQKGTSNQIQSKNKIRRMMKHFFRDRDCFTLVRPVQTEDKLQQLDTLEQEEFRSTFLDQSRALRQKILQKIKPKKLKNTTLTGETFFELAKSYVDVVNTNSLPNFQNSYKHLLKLQMSTLKRNICNQNEGKIKQLLKQSMQCLKSMQDYETLKHKYLIQIQRLGRQRIKSHNSLSGLANSQQIVLLIGEIKQSTINMLDKQFTYLKQQMRSIYCSIIDGLKQDNIMSESLSMIKTQKQLKQYINRLLYELNLRANEYKIPQFIMNELNTQLFIPYKNELQQQYNSLSSRRLLQQNKQLKTKLQLKQDLLKQKIINLNNISQQLILYRKNNYQLQINLGLLSRQLELIRQQSIRITKNNKQVEYNLQQQNKRLQISRLQQRKQLQLKISQLKQIRNQLQKKQNYLHTIDKQLTLNKFILQSKLQQLNHKQSLISKLQSLIQHKQLIITSLNSKIQELNSSKQSLFNKYINFNQQSTNKIIALQNKYHVFNQQSSNKIITLQKNNSKLSTQIKQLNTLLHHQQNYHHQLSNQLKSQYQQSFNQLKLQYQQTNLKYQSLQLTNTSLTQSIQHYQQYIQNYYKKQQTFKNFKKCLKNSSSIQCQHCTRFFMSSIFLTHLSVCTAYNQLEGNSHNNNNKSNTQHNQIIIFKIINVSVHQINNKPSTIYQLQCQKGNSKWTLQKKFSEFCQFNDNLINSLPGVQLSSAKTIFDPKYLSKKSLSMEQKQHLIEKYFNDLAQNTSIHSNKYWIEFILQKQNNQSNESLHQTKRSALKQVSNVSNTSTLNYQMRKGQFKDENMKSLKDENMRSVKDENMRSANSQSLRRQSVQTPQQFFKIWQQKQLRSKASSVCLKKNIHQ